MEATSVLSHLDHSLLRPTSTERELERACLVARELGVASVCLLPWFVERAAAILRGTRVSVSTVVGFPHGDTSPRAKLEDARVALDQGATELDFVVNVSALLSGRPELVREEIVSLTDLCHDRGARVKVIFENCYLEKEHKELLCELSSEAGADWVKTSTGFGAGGATPDDVMLMRRLCPSSVQVKASGGITTAARAAEFIALGASRIGTSRTEAIARELGRGIRS